MRLSLLIWATICAWTLIHAADFFRLNQLDFAWLFGTSFFIALYLFIAKIVEYIKEDFPVKLDVKIKTNKEKE